MPFSFVLCGVILFCVLFNIIRINCVLRRAVFIAGISLYLFGYFVDDLCFDFLSINMLFLFALILLLIYFSKYVSIGAFDILLICLVSGVYGFVLTNDLNLIINNNSIVAGCLVLLVSLLFVSNWQKGVVVSFILSFLLSLISSKVEFDNFNFTNINLSFVFSISICFFVINMLICGLSLFVFNKWRSCYEKRFYVGFVTCGNDFVSPWVL